jgi:transcriptional/translational regulatory protein YebC/TACO1
MTKDAVNRAIARGEPRAVGKDLSEMTYEVMLPGGIAVVV